MSWSFGRQIGRSACSSPSWTTSGSWRSTSTRDTFREPGISGGFVLNETTMRLVDTVELARLAHPEWFENVVAPPLDDDESPTTILIAEDSSFFRNQLSKFFEEQGFDVVAHEDGQLAWDYLNDEDHDVKLVITDIEMPNMNGFQLCQKVKQHERLGNLPVIALTSLTSEADVKHGKDVGMDDYQVKLDREQVMAVVNRLLPQKPKKRRAAQVQGRSQFRTCSCLTSNAV